MKIRFYIVSFTLLLLGATSVFAQQGNPPDGTPNDIPKAKKGEPPPAKSNYSSITDYSPALWKEYSFVDDNVRFRFPVEPKPIETTIADEFPTHTYQLASFMLYQLIVSNVSGHKDMEAESNSLDNFRNNAINTMKGKNLDPKVVNEEIVAVDGHAGRFMRIETNDGSIVRTKFFIVKNRVYMGFVMVRKNQRSTFNGENNFEEPAMAFLNSIHLYQPNK